MQLLTIFPLILLLATCCTTGSNAQWEVEEIDNTAVRPTTFFQALLASDFVRNKIDNFIDFVDLKLHQFNILKQLFTVDNLITLRRTLEWMVSATNLVIRILPMNPEKPTLITLVRDVFGGPAEEDESEEEELFELDQDPLNVAAATNLYSRFAGNTKTPGYLPPNSIVDGEATKDHLVQVFTTGKPRVFTTTGPAPPFQFGDQPSSAGEEEHPFTSRPATGDEKKSVKVTLSPEELKVLKKYGMTAEDAMRLAKLLYNARGDRQVRANFEKEVDRVAAMYGETSPQAVTLAKLIRGPYN